MKPFQWRRLNDLAAHYKENLKEIDDEIKLLDKQREALVKMRGYYFGRLNRTLVIKRWWGKDAKDTERNDS